MAFTAKLDSGTTIPTTFDDTASSLVVSGVSAGSRLLFLNYTAAKLMFCVGEYLVAPSSDLTVNRNQIIVPAASSGNPGFTVCDEITVGNQSSVYVRTDTGSTVSSGDVYVSIWAHR